MFLLAAFASGFAGLACEVAWSRGLQFLVHNSTYGVAIILFVFLVGIALGSLLARKLVDRQSSFDRIYGIIQLGAGLASLLTIPILYSYINSEFVQHNVIEPLYDPSYGWGWGILVYLVVCGLTFILPTTLMGVAYPVLNQAAFMAGGKAPGETVGKLYAWNTCGGIAGSLTAGFLLIPLLGIKGSIFFTSGVSALAGVLFLMRSSPRPVLIPAAFLIVGVFLLTEALHGKYLFGRNETESDQVLFYEEGLTATVKVYDRGNNRYMSIDGMMIAATSRSLLGKERVIAHLPFFIRSGLHDVLSVGLASGISTASICLHDEVSTVDCVELVRPVVTAADWFASFNRDVKNLPKVRLIQNDVFGFLRHTPRRYDLISSDGKLGPLSAGNTVMLSKEYYELCKARLNEGGMFIQWIPLFTPHEELKIIQKTLRESFQYVLLFYVYPSDVFMVASEQPMVLDAERVEAVLSKESVRDELTVAGLSSVRAVLGSFLGIDLREEDDQVSVNSFDRPILEFSYMRNWKEGRDRPGGHRATNLEYLAELQRRSWRATISAIFRNVTASESSTLVEASQLFLQGGVQYFMTGNPSDSFREFREFMKERGVSMSGQVEARKEMPEVSPE
jgi:spermidine synthase